MGETFASSLVEFQKYDWESVSPGEWRECFEELLNTSKRDGPHPLCSPNRPCKGDQYLKEYKKQKVQQLVLLQEVWARTGTNRDAFYQSLLLLHSMNILGDNFLENLSQSALTYSDTLVPTETNSEKCVSDECLANWYDAIEKTIERLPNTIPLLMTSESPLSNILSHETPNQSSSNPQQPQMQGKLVSLLKQSRFITDFEPVGFIGKGGFGTVLKARNKSEDLCYAIKIVRFRDFAVPSKRFQRVFREVTTLARLDHVNIVRYYSAWLELTEEYKDLLESLHLLPASNPEDTPSEGSEESEETPESGSYGAHHYLEDDMSMSAFLPYSGNSDDSFEDVTQTIDSATCEEDDEAIKIFGGGSAEVGFHGVKKKRLATRSHSKFSRPTLWRAESTSHIPSITSPRRGNMKRTEGRRINRRKIAKSSRAPSVPTVVPCEAVTVETSSNTLIHAKQFDYTLFIQTQLYEHNTLKQWLSNPDRVIDKKENLKIFSQIIRGLQHVHQHDLLHRDLKPANIFLSKDGTIKIGDFGLSRDLDNPTLPQAELKSRNLARTQTIPNLNSKSSSNKTFSVGTPGYVAPEILTTATYGPKVDVYSLGIVLMELFTKVLTKHEKGRNLMQLRDRVVPAEIERNFPDIAELILSMTHPDPEERLSLEEAAKIVDFAADDFKHLRKQIMEQDHKIKEQEQEILLLQKENAELRAKLATLELRG